METSDGVKLLSQEADIPEYPPPYEEKISYPGMPAPSNYDSGNFPKTVAAPPPSAPSAHHAPINQTIMMQPAASAAPQQIHVNVVNQGGMGAQSVGKKKMDVYCPNCRQIVRTKTNTTHKCCTHCCCLIMTICFPFCCIPYCTCTPEKVVHHCPNCNCHIGTYYG